MAENLLRSIPAMEALLSAPWAEPYCLLLGREAVKATLREVIEGLKRELHRGVALTAPVEELLRQRGAHLLGVRSASTLKRVVNATGVVIHTNLGRAPLGAAALAAVSQVAGAYSTLEYAPGKGARGRRNAHIEWLLCHITGAEAALVVNNNAAAVLLSLSTLAAGREVIVSAGELVEIGGSFRIPEILAFSGAKMVAVGCTNATRIADYRNAVTENTAVLLKVHPSNYRIDGFVATTSREELAELAAAKGLVFLEDLGSGLLTNLAVPFAHREHSVRECLKAGSGVVTFSGDKLLGGPQVGVIAGDRRLVERMKGHQLSRALRVDKMCLAAFEATLRLYLTGRRSEIPVIRMLEAPQEALFAQAVALREALLAQAATLGATVSVEVVETGDITGGGAYPTDTLPGYGVALWSGALGADKVAGGLRQARTPVIAGVQEGKVILHVRTLLPGDEAAVIAACAAVFLAP